MITPEEGRVLGALVEKELTTPGGYPLTDSALLAACNQTTSRDPVVAYDTAVLRPAVRSLREQGLLRTVHRTGERSDKHRHELASALGLGPAQVALLGLLLLRGPQTAAELRARSERWHPFASSEEVEDALRGLSDRPEPLAVRLERQPGRKEGRYAQVLAESAAGTTGGAVTGAVAGVLTGAVTGDVAGVPAGTGARSPEDDRPEDDAPSLADQVRLLREEVAQLRAEVRALGSPPTDA